MQNEATKKPHTLRMFLVLAALGAILVWFLSSQMQTLDPGFHPVLPEILISASSGERIDTRAFSGKPILVNFWGSWCAPCLSELPALAKAAKRFDNQVTFIGLAVDSPRHDVQLLQLRFGISYPLAVADMHTLATWRAEQLPTTYLLDKNGVIVWAHRGAVSESELVQRVVELIGIEPTTS